MNSAASSPRAAVAVVSASVLLGLAIGAALGFGSQNLVMGATIGGILALLFGGLAVSALRAGPAGRPDTGSGAAAASIGGYGGADGCGDGGGGGGDGGC